MTAADIAFAAWARAEFGCDPEDIAPAYRSAWEHGRAYEREQPDPANPWTRAAAVARTRLPGTSVPAGEPCAWCCRQLHRFAVRWLDPDNRDRCTGPTSPDGFHRPQSAGQTRKESA